MREGPLLHGYRLLQRGLIPAQRATEFTPISQVSQAAARMSQSGHGSPRVAATGIFTCSGASPMIRYITTDEVHTMHIQVTEQVADLVRMIASQERSIEKHQDSTPEVQASLRYMLREMQGELAEIVCEQVGGIV